MSGTRKRRRRDDQTRRGEHRKAASPETRVWNTEHLLPAQPSWMDATTYRQLAELRRDL